MLLAYYSRYCYDLLPKKPSMFITQENWAYHIPAVHIHLESCVYDWVYH